MRKNKKHKEILEIIEPYGYSIISGKKHKKIINKEGKVIYTMSSSSSDFNFHRQVIRDLRRQGLIDV